jgi:hypothetical protein
LLKVPDGTCGKFKLYPKCTASPPFQESPDITGSALTGDGSSLQRIGKLLAGVILRFQTSPRTDKTFRLDGMRIIHREPVALQRHIVISHVGIRKDITKTITNIRSKISKHDLKLPAQ